MTIVDAYAFGEVHAGIMLGNIVMAKICLGFEPGRDKDIDGNNEKLKKIFSPFSGKFWGGTQGEDGRIDISGEIDLSGKNIETNKKISIKTSGSFPLEVGYTSAVKTFFSLCAEGGVGRLARWPYGSPDIYLLMMV